MKAIILSGFLGAGKTSLLLQLASVLLSSHAVQAAGLQADSSEGLPAGTPEALPADLSFVCDDSRPSLLASAPERSQTQVAIIENEIGKVSVDGLVLSSQGLACRELLSGCVCCSLAGDFEATVKEIEGSLNPDWLIVEATGLAYPDSLAECLKATVKTLDSLRTLVLVDTPRFLDLEKVSPLIPGQVTFADTIILNKVDSADWAKRRDTALRLKALNGMAELVKISAHKKISPFVLRKLVRDE